MHAAGYCIYSYMDGWRIHQCMCVDHAEVSVEMGEVHGFQSWPGTRMRFFAGYIVAGLRDGFLIDRF